MSSRKQLSGFTLVEMIGVMAVIAILASVATPRIIDSIEDAKISSFVQQSKTLEGAIAKFYADTGDWPAFDSSADKTTSPHKHQLIYNAADASGTAITGWQGPYVVSEPENPFYSGGLQVLYETASSNWACDVDGNGTTDGKFIVYHTDNVSDKIAEKVSNILDGDGGTSTWKTVGRVKRYAGTSTSHLAICFARI